jgi:peptidoglycan/xylan/chitin deacetylase (PgdA/CDA1 family)
MFIFNLHIVKENRTLPISLNENLMVPKEDLVSFINKMRYRGFAFVSLDDFIDQVRNGIKSKSITLTADDGHPETLRILNKLSIEMKIPFCVYLTTDFMEGKSSPWWEFLDSLILENDYIVLDSLKVENKNMSQMQTNFMILRDFFMSHDIRTFLESIKSIFPKVSEIGRFAYKSYVLDSQDLLSIRNNPLISIGSHSVSHKLLTSLSTDDLVTELTLSKKRLESHLNREIIHFSYPYGQHNTFNPKVISYALKAGYKSAVTTCFRKIDSISQMELPRIDLTTKLATQNINRTLISIKYPYLTKNYSRIVNLLRRLT